MVQTIELLSAFYGNYVPDIFYYTKQLLLAGVVAANIANSGIGNIVAAAAKLNGFPHVGDGATKLAYLFGILLYKVQHQPQGSFFAYAG